MKTQTKPVKLEFLPALHALADQAQAAINALPRSVTPEAYWRSKAGQRIAEKMIEACPEDEYLTRADAVTLLLGDCLSRNSARFNQFRQSGRVHCYRIPEIYMNHRPDKWNKRQRAAARSYFCVKSEILALREEFIAEGKDCGTH